MTLTTEQLNELAELEQKATPGEWYSEFGCTLKAKGLPEYDDKIANLYDGEYVENRNSQSDALFIAALRNASKELIAEVQELRRHNRNLLQAISISNSAREVQLEKKLAKARQALEWISEDLHLNFEDGTIRALQTKAADTLKEIA